MIRRVALALPLALFLCLPACSADDDPQGSSPAASGAGAAGAAGTGAAGGAGGAGGGGGGGGGIDPRFQPFADAVEAERVALGAPGVAVAVIEGGEVTFAAGFGSKDPQADVPVLPTTLFRIGSVQKMLTTTALLQQVEAGNVDVEAPITDYAPDFDFTYDATWAPSIRVRDLLRHTSGIVDYLQVDVPASQQKDTSLETFLLGAFGNLGYLMAPAGSFWNYSNPGFYLAGYLVERTSGELYRAYMHDHVFSPLGMDRTFHLADEVLADGDYALGYAPGYDDIPEVVHPDSYDNAWARPAGYGMSSVLDLAKFVRFLDKGDTAVLSDELRQEMQTTQVSTEELLDVIGYGYGLGIGNGVFVDAGDFRPLHFIDHSGAIPGFSSEVFWAPQMDLGFVFLANTDGANFTDSLLTGLETLGTLPDAVAPPDLAITPEMLAACAGSYQDDFNVGPIEVTVDGNSLAVSMPGLDNAGVPYVPLLQPYAGRTFLLQVQGIGLPVTFILGESGTPAWLRTRVFVGARVEPTPGPAPRARAVDVDAFSTQMQHARLEDPTPLAMRRLRPR